MKITFGNSLKNKTNSNNICKDKYGLLVDETIETIFNEEINNDISIFKKSDITESFSDVLSSFDTKKELNKYIWKDENTMFSDVRLLLMDIADDFIDFLNVKWVKPHDVIVTGSIANYNWSKYSDIDLHIMMDFKDVDERIDFVKDYFDTKKDFWNEQHENLKIYGFNVELYVQDINEENTSSGVYSLYKNEWIVKPEKDLLKMVNSNKPIIKRKTIKYIKFFDKIAHIIETEKDKHKILVATNKMKQVFRKLKENRKTCLRNDNEMSIDNLVYKCLRRLGYLDKIIDLKKLSYDKINSLS